jgi:hypothetical protein
MRSWGIFVLVVLGAWLTQADAARAATTVRVVATDPSGETVTLGRNQNFYLRIGYVTDEPVSLWARPYFRGKQVNAGSNPSRTYTGTGEALGWFFFMQPGDRVDEIRITAGDGSREGTRLVATYPVRITGSAQVASPHNEPGWVVDMRRENERLQREAHEERMSTPPSAGGMLFFSGFMLAVIALGVSGFAAPAWALWRWRGGWRIAAAVPAAMMAFVVLRLLFDTARDPTSHNLWPFEILQVGALSAVVMLVLMVMRKRAGRAR